jgi:hypothetical protein
MAFKTISLIIYVETFRAGLALFKKKKSKTLLNIKKEKCIFYIIKGKCL